MQKQINSVIFTLLRDNNLIISSLISQKNNKKGSSELPFL